MRTEIFKVNKISGRRTLGFGLVALIFGIIIVVNGIAFTKLAFDFIALYLALVGLVNILLHFFTRKREGSLWHSCLQLAAALLLAWLNRVSDLPVNIIIIVLGIYQIMTAAIYGITYLLYRQNSVKGGFRYLFDTLLYGGIGLTSVLSPTTDGRLQFLIMGIYLIMLGISNMRDGLFFDVDREKNQLRRKIRINLPIIVAAFIPAENLNQFNRLIQGDEKGREEKVYRLVKDQEKTASLEVLIHTSKESLFGAIGHVDICYEGQVISYGSYDPFSEKLFGTIGDGVLFKVDKEAYIELCKKESKKTLFGYSLSLTEEEKQAVEKRLAEIDQLLEPWEPSSELKNGSPIYAYKLKHDLQAQMYKFKSSRFKSYFVLSTNCCLLADSIIGQAGTDILDIRGIIAPGTYQAYLQYELESANDLVVARNVYL